VMDGIIRSDRLFTLPGVVGIIGTGVAVAIYGHLSILHTGWIFWTLVLFAVSGLIFALCVAPMQRRLQDFANAGAKSGAFDYGRYRALAIRWEIWGAIALLTPVAGLVLMVLKPSL